MTPVSVQNKNFFAAMAAAVVALCKTLIRLFGLFEDVVAMGEKSVKVAREKQAIDLSIDSADYMARAVNNASLQAVKNELTIKDFLGDDPEKIKLMTETRAKFTELVNKAKAEVNMKED